MMNWSITVKGLPTPKKRGFVSIQLVFYKTGYARVTKVLSISGETKHWDSTICLFTKRSKEYSDKNNTINEKIFRFQSVAERWDKDRPEWTPKELSHCFDEETIKKKENSKSSSLLKMIDDTIVSFSSQTRYKNGRVISSKNNAKNYRILRNSLELFVNAVYQKKLESYSLSDVTSRFLCDYTVFIQESKPNGGGLRHKLKALRAILTKAKIQGFERLDLSVFDSVKTKMIEEVHTPKEILISDIKRIEDLDMGAYSEKERFYRDLFLFSFYTGGMANVDVCHLKQSLIKDNCIEYERTKCRTQAVPILNIKSNHLILKYTGKGVGDYVFPIFSTKHSTEELKHTRVGYITIQVNALLRKLCNDLSIKYKITWYKARGASISFMCDRLIPIVSVAKMAGNSPETIQKYYYRQTNTLDVQDQLNKIF